MFKQKHWLASVPWLEAMGRKRSAHRMAVFNEGVATTEVTRAEFNLMVGSMQSDINRLEREVLSYRGVRETLEGTIKMLTDQIEPLRVRVVDAEQAVASADKRVLQLDVALANAHHQIQDFRSELVMANNRIAQLEREAPRPRVDGVAQTPRFCEVCEAGLCRPWCGEC